jgi:hypothetical protein
MARAAMTGAKERHTKGMMAAKEGVHKKAEGMKEGRRPNVKAGEDYMARHKPKAMPAKMEGSKKPGERKEEHIKKAPMKSVRPAHEAHKMDRSTEGKKVRDGGKGETGRKGGSDEKHVHIHHHHHHHGEKG